VLQLHELVDQLKSFRDTWATGAEIQSAFAAHFPKPCFANLPVPATGAAVCAPPGTDRLGVSRAGQIAEVCGPSAGARKERQPNSDALAMNAPVFLRQSFVEWAGRLCAYSQWAQVYYERMARKARNTRDSSVRLAFNGFGSWKLLEGANCL